MVKYASSVLEIVSATIWSELGSTLGYDFSSIKEEWAENMKSVARYFA